MTYDAIVLGAGHNGLVAAAALARAGQRVLVLEKRAVAGGRLLTEEIVERFHFSPVMQSAGRLRPSIMHALRLADYGLRYTQQDPLVLAPTMDGRQLTLWQSVRRSCDEIARFSKKDAHRYPAFIRFMLRVGRLLEELQDVTPPPLTATDPFAFWDMGQLLLRFRLLPQQERQQLLRFGPMPAADFLDEWFETPLLKAALAAPALAATFAGPRAPGTAACLLYHESLGSGLFPQRSPCGAITQALLAACRDLGVEVRFNTEVSAIVTEQQAVSGVRLTTKEVLPCDTVISNVDPQTTFLDLVDSSALTPDFIHRIEHIRMRGTCARLNLALRGLPTLACLRGEKGTERLRGRIHIGPDMEYLENASDDAKYGRYSSHPVFELFIPTLAEPNLAPSGNHILSVLARSAPYHLRTGSWDDIRDEYADAMIAELAHYIPDLPSLIVGRQVLTPLDLERQYGLRGGDLYHGELVTDQLFHARPAMAASRYATPLRNLFLCGAGTHPGAAHTGASGANAAREVLQQRSGAAGDQNRKRTLILSSLGAGLALVGAGVAARVALDFFRTPRDSKQAAPTPSEERAAEPAGTTSRRHGGSN